MFAVAPIVAIGTAAVGFVLANHYLVAPFAEVDLRYFTKAKLVNVAIGAAAFGVVASPLLLYNWQVFGSPFFYHNTAHDMWLDATGQLPLFDQGLPTMLSYLAAHSAGQILGRFLSGLVWVRGIEWVWPFLLVFLCLPRRWLTYFRVGHEVDYILANRPMIQQRADIVYAYLTYTPAEGVQHWPPENHGRVFADALAGHLPDEYGDLSCPDVGRFLGGAPGGRTEEA